VPSLRQHPLEFDCAVFDLRREVLDRHRGDRSFVQQRPMVGRGAGGVADFQQRDGADPNEAPLDALRPLAGARVEVKS